MLLRLLLLLSVLTPATTSPPHSRTRPRTTTTTTAPSTSPNGTETRVGQTGSRIFDVAVVLAQTASDALGDAPVLGSAVAYPSSAAVDADEGALVEEDENGDEVPVAANKAPSISRMPSNFYRRRNTFGNNRYGRPPPFFPGAYGYRPRTSIGIEGGPDTPVYPSIAGRYTLRSRRPYTGPHDGVMMRRSGGGGGGGFGGGSYGPSNNGGGGSYGPSGNGGGGADFGGFGAGNGGFGYGRMGMGDGSGYGSMQGYGNNGGGGGYGPGAGHMNMNMNRPMMGKGGMWGGPMGSNNGVDGDESDGPNGMMGGNGGNSGMMGGGDGMMNGMNGMNGMDGGDGPPQGAVGIHMSNSGYSYAGYIERQVRSTAIMMYTLVGCVPCQRAKHLLAVHYADVKSHFLELVGDEDWQRQLQADLNHITGALTFPYIFVCGNYIGGSSDLFGLHQSGQLRRMVNSCNRKAAVVASV